MQPLIYRQLKPQLGFVLPLVQRSCTIYHHDLTAHCDRARSSATTSLPFGMALCRSAFAEPSRSEAAVPWEPPRLPPGWSPASLLTPTARTSTAEGTGQGTPALSWPREGTEPPKAALLQGQEAQQEPGAGSRLEAASKQQAATAHPPARGGHLLSPAREETRARARRVFRVGIFSSAQRR